MKSQSSSRASFEAAAYKALIIVINGATGVLCARWLAPAGRGELAALNLWYVFLASASTLGVPSALTYFMCRDPESKDGALGASLVVALSTSLVATAIGFVGMPFWLRSYPPEIVFFARVFLLNTPISALFLVGRAALESRSDFRASNASLLLSPLGTLIGLLAMVFAHRLTPITAAWCYVLAGLPALGWLAWQVGRQFSPTFHHLRRFAHNLLAYGIRSYGIDFCGTMALYIDQALVVRMLKPEAMGTYVVALSASRMLNLFHTSAVMVLFPRAVSKTPTEVIAMTERAARLSTLVATVCGGVVALIGPQLVRAVYGSQYASAVTVLRILIAEVVLSGATLVISQAFMALNRPGTVTTIQAAGLALTIPLLLVLVPRFGTVGAASALLTTTTIRFVLINRQLSRAFLVSRPKLLPRLEDSKYLCSLMVSSFRKVLQPALGGNV